MSHEQPRRTFRRADRLRASREFRGVSRRGKRASSGRFVVLVSPRVGVAETPFGRLGVTVSRRVGGAVVRNRVKRRLREWFRTSPLRGAGAFDCVVIARPEAARLSGTDIREELEGLCGDALAGFRGAEAS